MSKTLRNKVNNLENNVLQPFERGSTQFCPWALPEPEQKLFERARELVLMEIPFNEVTKDQMTILTTAYTRFKMRIFDLFTSFMVGLLCKGDRHAEITVHERFLWFIKELAKEVDQELEVAEIEKKMIENNDPVDKVDEYYRKAPELFTLESWYKLQDELFREIAQQPGFKKRLEATIKKYKKLTDLSKKGDT